MSGKHTLNEYGEPTARPQPKVIAATVGAGVGVALTTIGVWIVETATKLDVPAAVEGAAGVVVTAAIAFVAGYLKAPSPKAS